ncbi:aminotransferase class I/II-fold pyridoxal phosphate-dependent enzyme [Haliscomenobacter sp.]|uniref:aminotransferase class I/II-fold pyridoxal phosphate-dependent enzyme n=1 Tax=Haliscomenobacter sp. TaxID=2717303 RepID=UPI003592EE1F
MKNDFHIAKKMMTELFNREQANSLRCLPTALDLVDFYSNDYLGMAQNPVVKAAIETALEEKGPLGATGSRLISGNRQEMEAFEHFLATFHYSEKALLFNSGYAANQGLLSCMAERHDTIVYDQLIHASLREGLKLSLATHYSFRHNDLGHLEQKLQISKGQIFVLVESVYSMDGDEATLLELVELCEKYGAALIVDEAHATGVLGPEGRGLVAELGLEERVWARIYTFGKALGGHGAAICGPGYLIDYLINFSKPFIYTTALPWHGLAGVQAAYQEMQKGTALQALQQNIRFFTEQMPASLRPQFIPSRSAIQSLVYPGNSAVRELAKTLQDHGFAVWPILHPTVPKGQERLRICLHSFNTETQIQSLLDVIQQEIL